MLPQSLCATLFLTTPMDKTRLEGEKVHAREVAKVGPGGAIRREAVAALAGHEGPEAGQVTAVGRTNSL